MLSRVSNLVLGMSVCMLSLMIAQPQSASASVITYTFTGDYSSLLAGSDLAGLVGSSFIYTSTYERAPVAGDCSVDTEATSCSYYVGTSSLILSGTIGGTFDGLHSVEFADQSLVQDSFSTFFGSTSFMVGSFGLQIINRIHFDPLLFSGVGSLLPVLTTADIIPGTGEGRLDGDNVYGITNFTATSSVGVPEPAAVTLLALGLALLGLRRRYRY